MPGSKSLRSHGALAKGLSAPVASGFRREGSAHGKAAHAARPVALNFRSGGVPAVCGDGQSSTYRSPERSTTGSRRSGIIRVSALKLAPRPGILA